jgi:hypothetical protein
VVANQGLGPRPRAREAWGKWVPGVPGRGACGYLRVLVAPGVACRRHVFCSTGYSFQQEVQAGLGWSRTGRPGGWAGKQTCDRFSQWTGLGLCPCLSGSLYGVALYSIVIRCFMSCVLSLYRPSMLCYLSSSYRTRILSSQSFFILSIPSLT